MFAYIVAFIITHTTVFSNGFITEAPDMDAAVVVNRAHNGIQAAAWVGPYTIRYYSPGVCVGKNNNMTCY